MLVSHHHRKLIRSQHIYLSNLINPKSLPLVSPTILLARDQPDQVFGEIPPIANPAHIYLPFHISLPSLGRENSLANSFPSPVAPALRQVVLESRDDQT